MTFGNHVLAELEPWLEPAERDQLIASVGGVIVRRRLGGVESAVHFRLSKARTAREVLEIANRLSRDSRVVWAEPDFAILNPRPASVSPCVPLSPSPATTELNQNWWTVGAVPNWDDPNDSRIEPPPECGLVDAEAAMLAADAQVFLDGFETGDTSQWSREVQ